MPTLLIHIQNEDPVVGDVEVLPTATDTLLLVKNPRRKDGKDLFFLDANVTTVIWPINRINFIEVLPGVEEEDIITFVRE
jgi:hypothetical protein